MEVNIIKGEEFERKISSNLGELALLVLQTYKDNIIQIDAETGEKLTSWMILEKAKHLARFLIENGVKHGDAVSIMSENRLEFCVVTVGAFFAGATLAPINPQYTAGELNHVMGFSRPKFIFASPSAIPSINGCIRNHSYVRSVIVFGDNKEWNGFRHFDDIVPAKIARNTDDTFTVPHYDPKETIATILCSSGTSGVPKGVKTSHDNITACLDILSHEISKMNIDENEDRTDSMVGVTPFYHSFGFLTMFTHLLRGKTLVVFKKYKLKIFLDAIVKYKIRSLVIPPPLIVSLLKDEIVKQYDLSCIKEVYIGAAAVGKETELNLQKRFKIRHAAQSYGMTETTWAVIMNPHSKAKMGSVGKILPGMMAKVINETGKPLGAYQDGELCLKGPMIMKGYAKDIAATRSCIDEDNWLHTGDVAYYDNEGFFFIVDRLKELIKYKGFQVSPSELEDLLISHPAIADVAVIGIPDEYSGELPKAFVVKKPSFALSAEEVQEFVSSRYTLKTKQLCLSFPLPLRLLYGLGQPVEFYVRASAIIHAKRLLLVKSALLKSRLERYLGSGSGSINIIRPFFRESFLLFVILRAGDLLLAFGNLVYKKKKNRYSIMLILIRKTACFVVIEHARTKRNLFLAKKSHYPDFMMKETSKLS